MVNKSPDAWQRFDPGEREKLAKMVCRAMARWQISEEVQCRLLGLSPRSNAVLARYRRGVPVPDKSDRLHRAVSILAIYRCLASLYAHNPDLACRWPTMPNQGLNMQTPMEVMIGDGITGIGRIESYVEEMVGG